MELGPKVVSLKYVQIYDIYVNQLFIQDFADVLVINKLPTQCHADF